MTDEIRVAGGMQMKKRDKPMIVGPWRDNGASMPMRMDISAGVMEADEAIGDLQLREGSEEVVWMNEDEDGYQLFLPSVIEGTEVETAVLEEFNNATSVDGGSLDYEVSEEDVSYVDSEITVPENTQAVYSFNEYRTGSTMEKGDDMSLELVNYLEVDAPEEAVPVDLENFMAGDDRIHLDRIVYEVDLESGEAALYRSGEQIYDGDIQGMMEYVDETDMPGYDDELPETPSTVKVQESIAGGSGAEWMLDEQAHELLEGEHRKRAA